MFTLFTDMYIYSIYGYVCLLYLRICMFTLFTDMYVYSIYGYVYLLYLWICMLTLFTDMYIYSIYGYVCLLYLRICMLTLFTDMYVYSIYGYVCLLYLRICMFTLFTDMYIYSTNNNLDIPHNTLDIYDNEKHLWLSTMILLGFRVGSPSTIINKYIKRLFILSDCFSKCCFGYCLTCIIKLMLNST